MTQATQTMNPKQGLTRRQLLAIGWTVAGLVAAGEAGAATLSFMYPRLEAGAFGGDVNIGALKDVLPTLPNPQAPPNQAYVNSGRFYLTRTSHGIMALYRKCVHLGCVVPWNEAENQFHCPCHGSLYNREGLVLGGPAPRPLDYFLITQTGDGLIVHTGDAKQRKTYDASQAFPLTG